MPSFFCFVVGFEPKAEITEYEVLRLVDRMCRNYGVMRSRLKGGANPVHRATKIKAPKMGALRCIYFLESPYYENPFYHYDRTPEFNYLTDIFFNDSHWGCSMDCFTISAVNGDVADINFLIRKKLVIIMAL